MLIAAIVAKSSRVSVFPLIASLISSSSTSNSMLYSSNASDVTADAISAASSGVTPPPPPSVTKFPKLFGITKSFLSLSIKIIIVYLFYF